MLRNIIYNLKPQKHMQRTFLTHWELKQVNSTWFVLLWLNTKDPGDVQ